MTTRRLILNGDRPCRHGRLWESRACAVLARLRGAGFSVSLWSAAPDGAREQARSHRAQLLFDSFDGPIPGECAERYGIADLGRILSSGERPADAILCVLDETPLALRRRSGERVDELFGRVLRSFT
jgi:hypothetical protein